VAIASPTPSPTASATPAATPTATPTATPASGCSLTASLSLSGGAAGSAYYDLVLANAANAGSCTLTGFPTVTALDANGTSLGTATNSGTSASVTLAAGKTAYSLLRFPASGNFSASACHAMDSLSIAVPGVSGTLKISNIASYDSAHTAKYCGDLGVGSFSATKQ